MILFNILVFSFCFWNVFKEKALLSILFGITFLSSLVFFSFDLFNSTMDHEQKFLHSIYVCLGLGILGFALQTLSKYKFAQIVTTVVAVIGLNLYISNPHTPLDPGIQLDENAELLIRLEHSTKSKVQKDVQNLSVVNSIEYLTVPYRADETKLDDYFKVDIKEGYKIDLAIAELTKLDGVEWIEPNEVLKIEPSVSRNSPKKFIFQDLVNDPLGARQWNMDAMNMQDYYPLFKQKKYQPKKKAKLFILDSGVNMNHEDINSNFLSHKSIDRAENESDLNGHGTHCAGVASAISNNSKGIASMNPGSDWVSVSSVRVMNMFGLGTQAQIIEGMVEAIDAGADVLSMSLGGKSNQVKEEAYEMAIEYAESKNVIIVAASGNSADDTANYVPASSSSVIAVTALNKNLDKAQFSNYVTNITYGIAAPGVSILSTWKNGKYATFDGTSMAAPHVSGLIAVMRSIHPEMTTKEAFTILKNTGLQIKDTHLTGKMINPAKAIESLN